MTSITQKTVNAAVVAYAAADGQFMTKIAAMAKEAGATGETRWLADFAPMFKLALEKHMPDAASVILSRIKVVFIGVSNGIAITPKTQGLRPYYEANRETLQSKGLVKSTGAGRKPSAPGDKTAKAAGEAPSIKYTPAAGKVATASELIELAAFLVGSRSVAAKLVTVATSHKDQLVKFLNSVTAE